MIVNNTVAPPYAAGMRYPRPTRRECAPMSRRVGRGYRWRHDGIRFSFRLIEQIARELGE